MTKHRFLLCDSPTKDSLSSYAGMWFGWMHPNSERLIEEMQNAN